MSQATFASASQSNSRTAIALVFFALFLFVLFSENLNKVNRAFFSIIFIAALVVSHYSTAYIFFALLLGGFVVRYLGRKCHKGGIYVIRPGLIIISILLIFIWYAQVSDVNFTNGVLAVKTLANSMGGFFIKEARDQGTLKVIGLGAKSAADYLFSVSHFLIALFIAIGLIHLLYTRAKGIKLRAVLKEPEIEHIGMMISSVAILMAIIVMPYLSVTYTADRLWTQAIILLSFPFIIGFSAINGNRHTIFKYLLLAVMLFHFANANYLFYQVAGEPRSLVFNSIGPEYAHFFIRGTELVSSEWLAMKRMPESQIYSDFNGGQRLYLGHVGANWSSITFFLYKHEIKDNDYIYLSYSNVILDKVFTGQEYLSTKSVSNLLMDELKIYDNGESQIYG